MKLGDDLLALDKLVDLTPEERESLPASIINYVAYIRCMHAWMVHYQAPVTYTKIVMISWLLVTFTSVR